MIINESLRTCVAALDARYGPLWDARIDVDTLAMWSLEHCILGQLGCGAGRWTEKVTQLVGWDSSTGHTPAAYFANHDQEWKDFIANRRLERNRVA